MHGAVFPWEGLHLHTSLNCPFQVTSRPQLLDGRRHRQVPDKGPLSDAPAHRVNPSGQGARPLSSFCTPLLPQLRRGAQGPIPESRASALRSDSHCNLTGTLWQSRPLLLSPPQRTYAASEFPPAGQ